jgi:hypothetical protein
MVLALFQLASPLSLMTTPAPAGAVVMKALPANATVFADMVVDEEWMLR